MKKVWARIGMSLMISDEEYDELMEEIGGAYEFDINNEFAKRFVKDGYVDGDSYMPEPPDGWGTEE